MKVLVTGSSGQIGSYIVDTLRAAHLPDEVVGIDLRPSSWTQFVQDVRHFRPNESYEAIVHCAAQVSVPRSIEDPREDAAQNLDGTLAMLDLARRSDSRRIIYFSSAAVYGEQRDMPIREDAPTRPLSPYGLSKRAGEEYAAMYSKLYGLPACIVRPFNVFSARQDPRSPYSGVISRFASQLREGRQPIIDGDGEQTRDFIHANDVARAVDLLLQHRGAVGGTFNIATGKATTIYSLAEIMSRLSGAKTHAVHAAARVGDIRHSVADIRALRNLGFSPSTDLSVDLSETLRPPRS